MNLEWDGIEQQIIDAERFRRPPAFSSKAV